ncbi:Ubiquinone biosynthesis monooxygenase COQ6, mitochondrial [Halotydeus destructor]|nr:Ubiquinone biosynthesis monooxygenase COQ6, mitochondrial [Halotydeus destructor]
MQVSTFCRLGVKRVDLVRRSLCSASPKVTSVDQSKHLELEVNSSKNRSEHKTEKYYDIVINGGGIVGFSLLAALNKSPFFRNKKILLLEQSERKDIKRGNTQAGERQLSNRVSSLTTASKKFFHDVGVWSRIEPFTKQASAMHVWSHVYNEGITFSPRFSGLTDALWNAKSSDDCVCYFVENNILLNALESRVNETQVRYGSSAVDLVANDRQVELNVGDNEKIVTNLLIGCDGFNSTVRNKSNLKYFENKLKEKGIVGTVEMLKDSESDMNDIAFQRFYPEDGTVIALLPLTENYSSFVISAPNKRADALMQLSDDEFVQAMNDLLITHSGGTNQITAVARVFDEAIRNIFKSFNFTRSLPPKLNIPQALSLNAGSRASFPLAFATTVPSLVGSPKGSNNNKVVIIGDSSHRIQPLAGQGLNLGIGDAVELAECLERPLKRGENIFAGNKSSDDVLVDSLFDFERRRQLKLVPMMATVACMQTVFSVLPSSVLSSLNAFELLKNEIVKFANSR